MILDENKMELITNNGIIDLTFNELKIIDLLIKNKNRICFYKELILYIYSSNGANEENYKYFKGPLQTVLKRLRKKIKNEDIEIITIDNYGLFIKYNINNIVKKRFYNYEIEQKIIQLKNEIIEKENQISKLEEKLNER